MQQKFYVSHETKQLGPYSIDEILSLVGQGTLSPLDYMYDEAASDWIVLLEHDRLSQALKEMKPKAPPKVNENAPPPLEQQTKKQVDAGKNLLPNSLQGEVSREWFILKSENKFGPFSYIDVVKMLQQGVVFEYDYAWYEGMTGWLRIAEIESFSKENILALKKSSMPEINEVFFRRRFKRVKYGGSIIVHNNRSVWKGRGVEISEGGAGVIIEHALLVPGDEVHLHFKPGDGVPPFNAVCTVVNKQFSGDSLNHSSAVRYGLKFVTVAAETLNILRENSKKAS